MAAPVVSCTLDKSSYAIGQTMTLTITATDADAKSGTVSVVVTDAEGNASTAVVSPYTITDVMSAAVTDSNGKVFSRVTGAGVFPATYTATA